MKNLNYLKASLRNLSQEPNYKDSLIVYLNEEFRSYSKGKWMSI